MYQYFINYNPLFLFFRENILKEDNRDGDLPFAFYINVMINWKREKGYLSLRADCSNSLISSSINKYKNKYDLLVN